jgi:hypothetical protein
MVGGAVLLRAALWQWQHVRQAVASPPGGESGQRLLAAAGELALCVGWIALDGGSPLRARALYGQARKLAAGAGDPLLVVHVLTSVSMLEATPPSAHRRRPADQRSPGNAMDGPQTPELPR